jgi:4-hydroxybutyrate dehydrogenase
MTRTSFSFPTTIDFGPGALAALPEHIRAHGQAALIVTDPGLLQLPIFEKITRTLDDGEIPWSVYSGISPNPRSSECEKGGEVFRASGADVIVGVGGGPSLDGAKGIALMATHPAPMVSYDDAIGGDQRISNDVPPVIAIPTTAGTGSEVGRATVVVDDETHRKVVVFSPHLMPCVALIDPQLMTGMPQWLTAATGFDALTHNLEALAARGFHPMADGIALEGLALCGEHLLRATQAPEDLTARGGMAMAAMMGATAFQKGLGVCHSLAHPLSSLAGMHHGLANAVLLPYVVSFNRESARDTYELVRQRLGCQGDLQSWLVDLRRELGIAHTLTEIGIDRALIPALAEQAFDDACHRSNPRACTPADMTRLYEAAFDGVLDAH